VCSRTLCASLLLNTRDNCDNRESFSSNNNKGRERSFFLYTPPRATGAPCFVLQARRESAARCVESIRRVNTTYACRSPREIRGLGHTVGSRSTHTRNTPNGSATGSATNFKLFVYTLREHARGVGVSSIVFDRSRFIIRNKKKKRRRAREGGGGAARRTRDWEESGFLPLFLLPLAHFLATR